VKRHDSRAITRWAVTLNYALCPKNSPIRFRTPSAIWTPRQLLCAGIIGYRALRLSNLTAGREAGNLRIRSSGAHRDPDRSAPRMRGLRGNARRQTPAIGESDGGGLVGETATTCPHGWIAPSSLHPLANFVPPALAKLEKGGTFGAGRHLHELHSRLDYENHVFYERTVRSVTANTRQDGLQLLAEASEIPIRPQTAAYRLETRTRPSST